MSNSISLHTKIRILNSNVKAVLLYAYQTWRTTQQTTRKIQTLIKNLMGRILHLDCQKPLITETVAENKVEAMEEKIWNRRWSWLGHLVKKPADTTWQALNWNSEGKERKDVNQGTEGKKTLIKVKKHIVFIWREMERIAQDRGTRRMIVDGLCYKEEPWA